MISDKHQCIFVHLRRTAGNSIELSLGGITLFDENGLETNKWDNALHRGKNRPHKIDTRGHYLHDTALVIRDLFPEKFSKYMKFSIVRNPWDQMISLYLRLNASDGEAKGFKNFLVNFDLHSGTVPECSLFDKKGACLVDEIGRFESLEYDYKKICSEHGVLPKELSSSNKSLKRHYSEYYDNDTMDLVSRMFKKDISYFGYKFSRE